MWNVNSFRKPDTLNVLTWNFKNDNSKIDIVNLNVLLSRYSIKIILSLQHIIIREIYRTLIKLWGSELKISFRYSPICLTSLIQVIIAYSQKHMWISFTAFYLVLTWNIHISITDVKRAYNHDTVNEKSLAANYSDIAISGSWNRPDE